MRYISELSSATARLSLLSGNLKMLEPYGVVYTELLKYWQSSVRILYRDFSSILFIVLATRTVLSANFVPPHNIATIYKDWYIQFSSLFQKRHSIRLPCSVGNSFAQQFGRFLTVCSVLLGGCEINCVFTCVKPFI